jgi:hypothetical protein
LRSVAVVHVPVDDCDARRPELGLRVAGRNRDVVEEAKPHPTLGQRMVSRGTHERERTLLDGGDRGPRRQ